MTDESTATGTLAPEVLERLRSQVRGQMYQPGDPGYDEARAVYNAMIDRRPALIARCAGPAHAQSYPAKPVRLVVNFAAGSVQRAPAWVQRRPGRTTRASRVRNDPAMGAPHASSASGGPTCPHRRRRIGQAQREEGAAGRDSPGWSAIGMSGCGMLGGCP